MNTEDVKLLREMGITPDSVTPGADAALIADLRQQLAAAIESRDHWRTQATVLIEGKIECIFDGDTTLYTREYVESLREREERSRCVAKRMMFAVAVMAAAAIVDVVWRMSR